MPSLIGNKPNQVPSNGDLGTLAFQDASNPKVGAVVADSLVVDTNTLVVDSVNDRVGVGTSSPISKLQVGTVAGFNRELTASFFGTSNIASSLGAVGIYSTESAAVGVGPVLTFGGPTGNAASPYPYGFIQAAKNSVSAGDYGGYLRLLTVPANGGSPVPNLLLTTGGGVQALGCISVGNVAASLSGAGITFPATQSASSDANTLDDYEEGTWTPTMFGSTSGTFTLDSSARYVKIGRLVTLLADISVTAVNSPVGNMRIGGMPFAATTEITLRGAQSIIARNGLDLSGQTDALQMFANVEAGDTVIYSFVMRKTATARYDIDSSLVASGASFNLTITYFSNT